MRASSIRLRCARVFENVLKIMNGSPYSYRNLTMSVITHLAIPFSTLIFRRWVSISLIDEVSFVSDSIEDFIIIITATNYLG